MPRLCDLGDAKIKTWLPPAVFLLALVLMVVLTYLLSTPPSSSDVSEGRHRGAQSASAPPPAAASVQRKRREYEAQLHQAFAEYEAKAAQVWGDANAVMPSRHRWVEYHDGMRERRSVDFREGLVKVALAVEAASFELAAVQRQLREAVAGTLTNAPDQRSITEIAAHPEAKRRRGEPLLESQVATAAGVPVTKANARAFAQRQVARRALRRERVTGADGQRRVAVSTEFPLVAKHLRKRVERFDHFIRRYAEKWQLEPSLVFALIETESSFNPNARSPVPAFGLMQLVPRTGARDAYRYVYDEDRLVTDTYLYDPQNNVELGTAYLHKLFNIYVQSVMDPASRRLCAIAAYNTGVRNVLRAYVGPYSPAEFETRSAWREKAFRAINERTPAENFAHLEVRLPDPETRSYIRKVRRRMHKYRSADARRVKTASHWSASVASH